MEKTQYISVKEAAAIKGVHPNTILYQIKTEQIKGVVKVGNQYKLPRKQFINSNAVSSIFITCDVILNELSPLVDIKSILYWIENGIIGRAYHKGNQICVLRKDYESFKEKIESGAPNGTETCPSKYRLKYLDNPLQDRTTKTKNIDYIKFQEFVSHNFHRRMPK